MLCKIADSNRARSSVDRNLRRCIHKSGVSLPVEFELVETTIQLRKPKVEVKHVYWPCFSMRSWISVLAQSFPRILFGGFLKEQESKWRHLLSWFWNNFRECDPQHPVFDLAREGVDISLAIPFMTHGDEGRGLHSQAFMVESFQFVLSHLGPFTTNTSGTLGLFGYTVDTTSILFFSYPIQKWDSL